MSVCLGLEENPTSIATSCSHEIISVLDDIAEKNKMASWARLFKFARHCFAHSQRGGRGLSLGSVVSRKLQEEDDPSQQPYRGFPSSSRICDPMVSLLKVNFFQVGRWGL